MMDVLCCRITIGDADPASPMKITDGVEITEVHTLEINESYKKLIGTAKVTFPKGTVCRSTIIGTLGRGLEMRSLLEFQLVGHVLALDLQHAYNLQIAFCTAQAFANHL